VKVRTRVQLYTYTHIHIYTCKPGSKLLSVNLMIYYKSSVLIFANILMQSIGNRTRSRRSVCSRLRDSKYCFNGIIIFNYCDTFFFVYYDEIDERMSVRSNHHQLVKCTIYDK